MYNLDLSLCDLFREDSCHPSTGLVNVQHDLDRLGGTLHKNSFKNMNHELHCGEVVIEDDHPIELWCLSVQTEFVSPARLSKPTLCE